MQLSNLKGWKFDGKMCFTPGIGSKEAKNTFEGWDFDGTMCYSPKGSRLRIFRFIEQFFPYIYIFQRVKLKPRNPNIVIITASSNRVGLLAWLRLHRVKYHSIVFVKNFKEKPYFIKKLCNKYIEIE